ncbi:recombinase family protein [Vibrio gallicus]|uniref:recombinase family protein n=1 Tax=Vibrio gallicus TaxID=190897 RepID=UPI0021C32AC0|nr:recombinase family protein [Vibrio gallicus]
MSNTKAISYIRFSTKRQSMGDSERRQDALIQEACTKHGWEIIDHYNDLGQSAFKGTHLDGELGELISNLKKSHYPEGTVLVIAETDRLSRLDPRQARKVIGEILEHVDIHIVKLNATFSNKGEYDFGADIQLMIALKLSNDESKQKSERITSTFKKKKQAIVNGEEMIQSRYLPWWIDVQGDKYVLNRYADIARRIIALRLQGMGQNTITDTIREEFTETPPSIATFDTANVRIFFTNISMYGSYKMTRPFTLQEKEIRQAQGLPVGHYSRPFTEVENFFPPLTDKDTFELLQKISSKRVIKGGRTKQFNNPLRGLAICSNCGKAISVKSVAGKGHVRGLCTVRVLDSNRCSEPTFRMFEFTDVLLRSIAHVKFSDTGIDEDDLQQLHLLRTSIEEEIQNSLDALGKLPSNLQGQMLSNVATKQEQLDNVVERLTALNYKAKLASDNTLTNLEGMALNTAKAREDVNNKLLSVLTKVVINSTKRTYSIYFKNGEVISKLSMDGGSMSELYEEVNRVDEPVIDDFIND